MTATLFPASALAAEPQVDEIPVAAEGTEPAADTAADTATDTELASEEANTVSETTEEVTGDLATDETKPTAASWEFTKWPLGNVTYTGTPVNIMDIQQLKDKASNAKVSDGEYTVTYTNGENADLTNVGSEEFTVTPVDPSKYTFTDNKGTLKIVQAEASKENLAFKIINNEEGVKHYQYTGNAIVIPVTLQDKLAGTIALTTGGEAYENAYLLSADATEAAVGKATSLVNKFTAAQLKLKNFTGTYAPAYADQYIVDAVDLGALTFEDQTVPANNWAETIVSRTDFALDGAAFQLNMDKVNVAVTAGDLSHTGYATIEVTPKEGVKGYTGTITMHVTVSEVGTNFAIQATGDGTWDTAFSATHFPGGPDTDYQYDWVVKEEAASDAWELVQKNAEAYTPGKEYAGWYLALRATDKNSGDVGYSNVLQIKNKTVDGNLTADSTGLTYDGKEKEPKFMLGGAAADHNYFTVEYIGDKISAGTQEIAITAAQGYELTGQIADSYTIAPAASANVKVLFEETEYTGNAPAVKFSLTDTFTDKAISYEDKDKKDVTTFIYTPTDDGWNEVGEYTSTKTLTNLAAGNAALNTALSNFDLTKAPTALNKVVITERDLDNLTATTPAITVDEDAANLKTHVQAALKAATFRDADGEVVALDTADLKATVKSGDFTKAGTVVLTITGDKNNYTGSVTLNVTVNTDALTGADLYFYASAADKIAGKVTKFSNNRFAYQESAITLDVAYLQVGNLKVQLSDLNAPEYKDNVNAGSASVTYTGKAGTSFAGASVTYNFTITKVKIDASWIHINGGKEGFTYDDAIGSNIKDYKINSVEVFNPTAKAEEHVYSPKADVDYVATIDGHKVTLKPQEKDKLPKDFVANYDFTAVSKTFDTLLGKDLSDGNVKLTKTSYEYTGESISPEVEVTMNGKTLKQGIDYQITGISNAKNVGTASAVVKGIGLYSGKVTVKYDITAKSVTDKTVTALLKGWLTPVKDKTDAYTKDYSGEKIEFSAEDLNYLKDNQTFLVKDKDYTITVDSESAKEVGSVVTYTITGKGNYKGTRTLTATIVPKTISVVTVLIKDENGYAVSWIPPVKYTGAPITLGSGELSDYSLEVTSMDRKTGTYAEGTDYEVVYVDNEYAGTASIYIKPLGNYRGNDTVTDSDTEKEYTGVIASGEGFEIKSTGTFILSGIKVTADSEYAAGEPVKPIVEVTNTVGKKLTEGKDFEVRHYDDTEVGTGCTGFTVQGIGGYGKTAIWVSSLKYNIVAMNFGKVTTAPIADQAYTGKEIKPAVQVSIGKQILTEGTDYTVTYSNNIKAGTAKAIIKAVDTKNYTGTKEVAFKIVASTGWAHDKDGDWVYYKNGKTVANQWIKSGASWYFLGKDSKMLADGLFDIFDHTFLLNKSGAMLTGWRIPAGMDEWMYFNKDGYMMKSNWILTGGKWYYLGKDGKMLRNEWCGGGKQYYVDGGGVMSTNRWILIEGKWYRVDADGKKMKNTSFGKYNFDANGVCLNP